jgi:V/A-type H+-transporting ATPase subunit I
MLRARATRWFEVITTRDDLAAVMHKLAQSGAVQLQAKPIAGTQPALPQLARFFDAFADLERTHSIYWPKPAADASTKFDDPAAFLDAALKRMERWRKLADPVITELQGLENEHSELILLEHLLRVTGDKVSYSDLALETPGFLRRAVFFLPEAEAYQPSTQGAVVTGVAVEPGLFVVAVAEPAVMADLRAELNAEKAREITIPEALRRAQGNYPDRLRRAQLRNADEMAECRAGLDRLSEHCGLPDILARIAVLRWLHENRDDIQATHRTIRITGWTDSESGEELREHLNEIEANYVLTVAEAADHPDAPMVLSNPGWLKPFEFFPRMLGVPARGEADPSVVTAIVAPLMFGFMFGDVGQGAVLLLAGLMLRKRLPLLGILVPGGVAAMVFGVLFGSVFSLEHVIAPLWLHPMEEPIAVLVAALTMGVGFLLLGIALDFLQSFWRGASREWLERNGGVVLTYLSLLLTIWVPAALWGLPLGVALTLAGAREDDGRRSLGALAASAGEYVEVLMRLLVSSVSFARVGAFALAHAGLSTAIVGIAESAGSVGFPVVLLLGNVLIIALEGLVTGIQTTRLVLFEFFTRFFRAGGREFVPLKVPEFHSELNKGNTS